MKISYTRKFLKDLNKAKSAGLLPKIKDLIEIISKNYLATYPPFEKLTDKNYSRRINVQHRLVYAVTEDTIIFLRCWGHYE